jgi:hypothetical protein
VAVPVLFRSSQSSAVRGRTTGEVHDDDHHTRATMATMTTMVTLLRRSGPTPSSVASHRGQQSLGAPDRDRAGDPVLLAGGHHEAPGRRLDS